MPDRDKGNNDPYGPLSATEPTRPTWVTISDLARFEGVTKTAISRRVARLAVRNRLETRTGKSRAREVNLDQYEGLTGKHFDPTLIPVDEISRLAVRGEISTVQLMAARRYRLICRARDAQFLRRVASLLSRQDVDLCQRLLLDDQSFNDIARNLHYVRRSLLERLWSCLDTLTREFFPQQAA